MSNGGLISGAFAEQSAHTGTKLTTAGDLHGYGVSNTRIPIGVNDTVLTADSTETLGLKWAAAGGGGGQLILVNYTELDAVATSLTTTLSPAISADDNAELIIIIGGGSTFYSVKLTFNGDTTENYDYQGTKVIEGTESIENQTNQPSISFKEGSTPNPDPFYAVVHVTAGTSASSGSEQRISYLTDAATATSKYSYGGTLTVDDITAIDEVSITTGGTNKLRAGTYMAIYRVANS